MSNKSRLKTAQNITTNTAVEINVWENGSIYLIRSAKPIIENEIAITREKFFKSKLKYFHA